MRKKKIEGKAISKKKEKSPLKEKYVEAIGRRKTATCRVRVFPNLDKKGEFIVNEKVLEHYFPDFKLQKIVFSPLKKTDFLNKFKIEAKVRGGGKRGQAEAIRLGLSKALIKIDKNLRESLRNAGYLTRDPRIKERKKFGLKKARKAPQWQKR